MANNESASFPSLPLDLWRSIDAFTILAAGRLRRVNRDLRNGLVRMEEHPAHLVYKWRRGQYVEGLPPPPPPSNVTTVTMMMVTVPSDVPGLSTVGTPWW